MSEEHLKPDLKDVKDNRVTIHLKEVENQNHVQDEHRDINKNATNDEDDGKTKSSKKFFSEQFHKKHPKINKYIGRFFIHLILIAFFAWSTQYFLTYSDVTFLSTTCTGYGFLVILYIFIYFGLFYYLFLKPFVLPIVFKPFKDPYKKFSSIKHIGTVIHSLFLLGCLIFVVYDSWGYSSRLMPLVGLVFFILFGFVFSSNHRKINWDIVIAGINLQFIFGILAIRWEVGRNIFICIGDKATVFLAFANNGSEFVYGNELIYTQQVFAFKALSTIMFVAMIVNILHHYGILQKAIVSFGEFLQFFMGTTICESVNSASQIILGQSEAPLLLKHYLELMTDSELHSVMLAGFATVSGSVLAGYISFGAKASDLITASVMSAPAALCYSKLLYPETQKTMATKENIIVTKSSFRTVLDAACSGASQGIELVMGIIANLIAFIAFVAMVSGILEWCGNLVGYTDENETWVLYRILGYVFMPIGYIIGVPWDECYHIGRLIGIKTIVNEFAAFEDMSTMTLTERTKTIATYAICGFSNPGSIGITLSALSKLVPSKKEQISRLVIRAFVGGTVVCLMTACIAATLITDTSV